MNYLDLFHGIGGFALGAHWAGMKFNNHFCSDIEPFAVELYKKRFPDSIQLGDITKIDWHKLKKDYPGEWIISGGFPCQDISNAGKGKGLIDEKTGKKTRSGLWYDYQKGISILRPRYAIMENVAALIIRGLDDVLRSLSKIGYNAEWDSIKASDVGAPHRRERIWIISYPRHNARSTEQKQQCKMSSKKFVDLRSDRMEAGDDMADSNSQGLEKWQRENTKRERSNEWAKFSGENWWSFEPPVGRLADGISRRVDRLKGDGNAIVPQIAEILFRIIK